MRAPARGTGNFQSPEEDTKPPGSTGWGRPAGTGPALTNQMATFQISRFYYSHLGSYKRIRVLTTARPPKGGSSLLWSDSS